MREYADETESARRLAAPVVDAMTEADLYKIAAPSAVGGGEIDPETQIRVIETISEADGATGWTLMIGIEIKHKVQEVLGQLLDRQIIALPAGPNVIRLLPPLVIEKEQLDRVADVLQELLA